MEGAAADESREGMQDRTGSRWAFVPGQELPRDNPHSPGHQRSDLQHTRVDSSQKNPSVPQAGANPG